MFEEDINYLKSDRISKIVSQGLAETFLAQPKYPVDFMAKWLLKHCEMEEALKTEAAFQTKLISEKEAYQISEYKRKLEEDSQLSRRQTAQVFKADFFRQLKEVNW